MIYTSLVRIGRKALSQLKPKPVLVRATAHSIHKLSDNWVAAKCLEKRTQTIGVMRRQLEHAVIKIAETAQAINTTNKNIEPLNMTREINFDEEESYFFPAVITRLKQDICDAEENIARCVALIRNAAG